MAIGIDQIELFRTGTGSPEGVVTAAIGTWYFSDDGTGLYQKTTGTGPTGWTQVSGGTGGTANLSGTVDPNGSVTSDPGALYVNTSGSTIWFKSTGTGNTGWISVGGGSSSPVAPLTGIGSPEGVTNGDPGATYRDTGTGNLYMKSTGTGNTGWVQINSSASVPSFYSGAGTPEGTQVGNPEDYYWDTTNDIIYHKETGTGNTGWVPHNTGGSAVAVAHSTTLTFDQRIKEAASHTQAGALTYTLAGAGNVAGNTYRLQIVSDGTNPITWPTQANFVYGHNSGSALAAGTYEVFLYYRTDGAITVNVRGSAPTNSINIADPGAGNTAVVAFDPNSGIDTFSMTGFSSAGIGLNFTGLSNNQGVMMLFLDTPGTGTIDPALIQVNGGATAVSFFPDFNWTTGFGGAIQRYAMVVEMLNNEAVVMMSTTGNATT